MSRRPLFLTLDQVKRFHSIGLAEHGGTDVIREPGLLESAVRQPQNVYCYENGDLFDLAAVYAFHIAQAQAFLDGNKRTAVIAALTFLEINGIETAGDSMDLYQAMIEVAQKKIGRDGLAKVLHTLASGN